MVRTTVMLPADLKSQAQRLAEESGQTLGDLVRQGLQHVVEQGKNGQSNDILHLGTFDGPRESAENITDILYGEWRK